MPAIKAQIVPLDQVPHETGPDRHPLLLIVDDEPLVADTLVAVLEREGFAVMKAYNAVAALKLAALRTPELMITDIAMPGMSGIELAVAMQELCPTCKTLLFSGHNSSGNLVAESGQEFCLLTKPIHPTKIVSYIARELDLPEYSKRTILPFPVMAYRETA